jgi:hypothetical protein
MVDAKQLMTRVLSWFRPRGRTSSSGVLEALYCLAPGVPVVGRLQARRERKRGSQVLVKWLNWRTSALFCLVLCPDLSVPCGGGVRPPFIGQGENESHVCHAILLRGEVWCAML